MPRDVIQNADGSISVRVEALQDLLRGEEDDSLEGEDDDSLEGEEDAEFGADKKKKNLLQQLFGKKDKKKSGSSSSAGKTTTVNITGGGLPPQMDPSSSFWETAIEDGDVSSESAGSVKITIRIQESFWADSVLFNGSTAGATIKRIKFGPKNVYEANGNGVDVSVFQAANPIMSNILKGTFIEGGRDITIEGTLPSAGDLKVMFQGRRKAKKSC